MTLVGSDLGTVVVRFNGMGNKEDKIRRDSETAPMEAKESAGVAARQDRTLGLRGRMMPMPI